MKISGSVVSLTETFHLHILGMTCCSRLPCCVHQLTTTPLSTLSTCSPVRPSTRPSSRLLLTLFLTHRLYLRRLIECVGLVPEWMSPTGNQHKDLTEEDTSTFVKPMFFHKPSMTSIYDTSGALRHSLPNRIWTMNKYGKCWLHLCTHRRVKQVLTDHEFITLSEKAFLAECRETCPVFSHERKSSRDTFSDRDGISSGHQTVQGKGE